MPHLGGEKEGSEVDLSFVVSFKIKKENKNFGKIIIIHTYIKKERKKDKCTFLYIKNEMEQTSS